MFCFISLRSAEGKTKLTNSDEKEEEEDKKDDAILGSCKCSKRNVLLFVVIV
jgi:hypothetical protein